LRIIRESYANGGQKLDELHIRVLNNNSAFVAVSETWIDNTIENSSIDIPGFEIIRKDRNREGGGVALYVRTDLVCTELESPLFEALWACVLSLKGVKYWVSCIPLTIC
jgi:hypothetical protein